MEQLLKVILEQAKLGTKLRGGEPHHADDFWSREDFEVDYTEKIAAAKDQLRLISKDGAPVATKIIERFIPLCSAAALAQGQREAEEFKHWGLPYSPSPIVLALRKAGDHA